MKKNKPVSSSTVISTASQFPPPSVESRDENTPPQNRFRTDMEKMKETDTERSAALQQFATQLGYRSDQTGQFEEYIKFVYDMTSTNPGGGRRNNRGNQPGQQDQPNRR